MQVRESSQVSKAHGEEKAITDGMLVTRTLSGDQSAFELLVQRYNTPSLTLSVTCLVIMTWRVMWRNRSFCNCISLCPRSVPVSHSKPGSSRLLVIAVLMNCVVNAPFISLNLKVMARMTIFHRWISCLTHSLSPMRWLSAAICGLHYTKQLMRCQ